jgi:hypothetical protein
MSDRYVSSVIWATHSKCARCGESTPDGGGRMVGFWPVLSKEVWADFYAGRRHLPGAYNVCLSCHGSPWSRFAEQYYAWEKEAVACAPTTYAPGA